MKLIRFKVQNFRSFIDSGWVDCQNVTAIAGVNEAGKSNLLRALWKLKPAFKSDNKILQSDIPIDRFDKIKEEGKLPIFIAAEFQLTQSDKLEISQKLPEIRLFDTVTVSRYLSGEYLIAYPIVVASDLRAKLDQLIFNLMPGFVYFSNYGNLDSNIYLPQILDKFNKSGLNTISNSKRRTAKLLLMYIGITPEMLACDSDILINATKNNLKLNPEQLCDLANREERYKKLFKQAGEKLTKEFNQWWRQGEYKFEFAFDSGNLTIYVSDENGIRAPLQERSVGMQWFLSFFLVFSLESKLFYSNSILLLDESGATLHSLAQQDLVRFFDELSKTSQIIYSTHSNFMLPMDKLSRTRVIYRDIKGHSVVTSDMNVQVGSKSGKAGLIPVSTTINLELTNNLLNGHSPVIVVSRADEMYFNMMKNMLAQNNILTTEFIKYSPIFVFVNKEIAESTAQILTKKQLPPYIFMDMHGDNLQIYDRLKSNLYKMHEDRIFTPQKLSEKYTFEDFIPYEVFAKSAGNYLVSLFGSEFSVKVSKPFIPQLEESKKDDVLPQDYRDRIADMSCKYILDGKLGGKTLKQSLKLWGNIYSKLFEVMKN